MNIAFIYKKQGNNNLAIENLLSAKDELVKCIENNNKYHLPYNNLANINRNFIEIEIGIKDFYKDYRNINFKNLGSSQILKISKYIEDAHNNLKQSISFEPNFIDNYYNEATFYLYKYLLDNKKYRKYINRAKPLLKDSEVINPQSRKMLRIKEIIYELRRSREQMPATSWKTSLSM